MGEEEEEEADRSLYFWVRVSYHEGHGRSNLAGFLLENEMQNGEAGRKVEEERAESWETSF